MEEQQQPINFDEQNDAVKNWGRGTLSEIKNRYSRLIRDANSGKGFDSLKNSYHKSFGEIDSISFKFERYLIFVKKGAGKGYGGSKGSSWYDKLGNRRQTNANSFGKMGTGSRVAKDWINPVLDERVPILADLIAKHKADTVVKSIRLE